MTSSFHLGHELFIPKAPLASTAISMQSTRAVTLGREGTQGKQFTVNGIAKMRFYVYIFFLIYII